MTPEILFFDAAGTLLHLPRGVGFHYCEVARRHGAELDETGVGRAFRAAFHALPNPPVTRAPRSDDDRGWWQALVVRILDEIGVPSEFDREAYFDELYREFARPGVWQLYPEAREVLETLATRYRMAVISNFDGRLRSVLRHEQIDHLFEFQIISSEVGADKPDPWIYEAALRQAGLAAGAALHVGDDPEGDWAAAEAAGLQVFRLRRPENSLRDLLTVLQPTPAPASGKSS